MLCQSKYLPFSLSYPLLFHIWLENLYMDLVHSKVSLAFVISILNIPRGSAAPSLAPSLCYAPLPCWSLPCWYGLEAWTWTCFVTAELHDCHGAVAQTCLLSSVLLCPPCSGTARLHPCWWEHHSFLLHCHYLLLLAFYVIEQLNFAVLLLLLVVFLFAGVSLFIIIIQQIASQLKLKGHFMEIGIL